MRALALLISALLLTASADALASAPTPDSGAVQSDSAGAAQRPARRAWNSSTTGGVWIRGGLGGGWSSVTDAKTITPMRFGLTVRDGIHRFSADYTRFDGIVRGVQPDERIETFEITYGRAFEGRAGFVALSAGLGYITGARRGELIRDYGGASQRIHERDVIGSLCLPVRVEWALVKGFTDPAGDEYWWLGATSVHGGVNISQDGMFYTVGWAVHFGLF